MPPKRGLPDVIGNIRTTSRVGATMPPRIATLARAPALAVLVALGLVGASVGATPSASAAADVCPHAPHLKPSCHLEERAVCHCTRHGGGIVVCAWSCEPKP